MLYETVYGLDVEFSREDGDGAEGLGWMRELRRPFLGVGP
jgi:hypothetical protein